MNLGGELSVDFLVVGDDGVHGEVLFVAEGEFLLEQTDGLLLLLVESAIVLLNVGMSTACWSC